MAQRSSVPTGLTAVVVARRGQLYLRIGLCLLTALIFHPLSGILAAVAWAGGYSLLQLVECSAFRRVDESRPLGANGARLYLLSMGFSNIVFASYGLVVAGGGVWGVVCAGLLWSGTILNGTIVSGSSRAALAVSIGAPILFFASMPFLTVANGGSIGEGLAIFAGGVLNAIAAVAIWAATRRLIEAAARARETERTALLDAETGLPNRAAAERRIGRLKQDIGNAHVVVAAVSIDRFERLHGAIGHTLSIALIREVAARLSAALPAAEVVQLSARMLGVVWTACNADEARKAAGRLHQALEQPVLLGEHTVDISVTIGLAGFIPDGESDVTSEFSKIDRAMMAVDQAHELRRGISWFDAARYGDPARNLSLMSDMLKALDNGEMSVVYQPKYGVESGEIVGAEALVRWFHPERGQLPPDSFLPMAEETGHIATLTAWVLRRVIEDQRLLADAGHDIAMAVNLSGRLIDDADFTRRALRMCDRAVGQLVFEVTETAIIGNPSIARQTLEAFRGAGIAISIDDYGSGFSSLAYLKNIPADELKIDKSFVIPMGSSHTDYMLVRSAIDLGHSLGLRVVAEGVETESVLEMLGRMRCDVAQGFLIARPMSLVALAGFLKSRPEVPAPPSPWRPTVVSASESGRAVA